MPQFYKLNNITGWLVFAIALISYSITMEPTVSFWDCGEFISAAFKLQIVHPPGSPLHAIVGRLFTILSPDNAALMMNFLSALSSAFCVLFSFWTVSYLGRKALQKRGNELSGAETLGVLGAAAITGLTATYLDSFWFSAIEAEVYAFSAFFTFAMIWAMFKWDYNADKPYGDRWLVLIALLTGLGVGVHLLHLLVIPGLAYIYYFRRYEFTWKGAIITFLVGFGILAFVLWGVLDYFVRIASRLDFFFVNTVGLPLNSGFFTFLIVVFGAGTRLDFFFVNTVGLPLNSGFFTFLIVVFGAGIYGIYYARQRNIQWLQLSLLSFLMIIIGFSSYSMVMLRSNANPPINMNEPKDPYTLHSYLKREQYGSRPLIYGPYFTAQPLDFKETGTRYRYNEKKGKYVPIGKKTEYLYEVDEQTIRQRYPNIGPAQINMLKEANKMILFPRMGSNLNPDHARQYRAWLGLGPNEMPTYGDNLEFFFKYQLGYMYFRYFMWNFSGRQDDIQGHIDRGRANGNWISGIPFIDKITAGVHMLQPESMASDARNKFYMLPLILGLIGFFYHFKKDKKMAFVVLMLFVFTGLMNIINSNQPPSEPRERDYAVAISFVLFAYWVGMGVLSLFEGLREKAWLSPKGSAIAALAVSLVVPGILAAEGWDDHHRGHRYLARDSAINYLESVAPNAILFTQGDNDTYPLWYAQEVEGIRTDVRIINLSLLAVDWYVDQLHNAINDAPPVKLRFDDEHYMGDNLLQTGIQTNARFKERYGNNLDKALDYVKELAENENLDPGQIAFPIRNFVLPLDTTNPSLYSMVPQQFANARVNQLEGRVGGQSLVRDELILLDIIASNFPERPIYFSVTVDQRKHLGLSEYMQREGMAWRLIPADPQGPGGQEFNNSEIMYKNITEKWAWGNLGTDKHVYMEETAMRTAKMIRGNLIFLAQLLASENKNEKSGNILALLEAHFPTHNVPYTAMENLYPVINTYVRIDQMDKAKNWTPYFMELAKKELRYNYKAGDLENLRKRYGNNPGFLFRMNQEMKGQMPYYASQLFNNLSILNAMVRLYQNNGDQAYAKELVNQIKPIEQELNMTLLDPSLLEM